MDTRPDCAASFASSRRVSDPRSRRLSALADGLTAAHLDGLLITSLPNIRYLTGFSGSSALLFISARDVLLITDFRYQTQVAGEVGDLARVSIEPQSLWTGLWQQLSQLPSLEVVGFESGHILHRDFQRLLDARARTHSAAVARRHDGVGGRRHSREGIARRRQRGLSVSVDRRVGSAIRI